MPQFLYKKTNQCIGEVVFQHKASVLRCQEKASLTPDT